MTKAWCVFCETGQMPKHGYFWIHTGCFEKVAAMGSNIKAVEEYLKGERPRISKGGNQLGRDTVEQFLVDMYDFDRKMRNVSKLFKAHREGTPIGQIEFEQRPLQTSNKNAEIEE